MQQLRDNYCRVTKVRVCVDICIPTAPWNIASGSLWLHVTLVWSTFSILDTILCGILVLTPPLFYSLSPSLSLHLSAAIYPATTLTPIGQTLPQPPQVIQQQQQREGEGERTLLLLHFTHLIPCNRHIKKTDPILLWYCVVHRWSMCH